MIGGFISGKMADKINLITLIRMTFFINFVGLLLSIINIYI